MTKTETPSTNAQPLWKRSWFRRTVLVGAVPALAVAWWLGSPLFLDRTVDEAFPVAAVAAPTTTPAPTTDSSTADSSAADSSAADSSAADSSAANSANADSSAEEAPEAPVTTAAAPAPVAVASGGFVGADAAHDGSGTATIYEVGDAVVLRFEQFEVTNGPDLRVNLVLADGSMVDLGELTGNIGNQNYDVPADLDLASVESVLIYCRAFSVPFAEAELA